MQGFATRGMNPTGIGRRERIVLVKDEGAWWRTVVVVLAISTVVHGLPIHVGNGADRHGRQQERGTSQHGRQGPNSRRIQGLDHIDLVLGHVVACYGYGWTSSSIVDREYMERYSLIDFLRRVP